MLSAKAIAMGGIFLGGAAGAGIAAHRYAAGRQDFDTSDKAGFTGMSALAGGVAGLSLAHLGPGRMYQAAKGGMAGIRGVGKALAFNPVGRMMGRKGMGLGSVPKAARGPLGLLAMAALTVGAVAYSSRSNNDSAAYAAPDGSGGTAYNDRPRSSVKERAGLLGATGDMVFGLNNARHG